MSDRQRVSSGAVWEESVGYSRAVRVRDHVWVAGTTAAGSNGDPVGGDDAYAQTREALRRVVAALAEVGASPADVVRTRMYVTDIAFWAEVGRAHGEVFGDVRPVATMLEVSALIDRRLVVEVEAEAVLG
ncbi:RidA family protein [Angustibacter luteus]|uniref:RidA family protein n=1 Tax=Angustibacter luteus TaxID=658456 RepID=A0ABW1JC57_9ACTN